MTDAAVKAVLEVAGPMFSPALAREVVEAVQRADPARAALSALLQQIEISDYKDELGHPLKMNLHYLAVLKLIGTPTNA